MGDPGADRRLIVVTAYMGEQQKPGQVLRGMLGRVGGLGHSSKTMGKGAGGMAAAKAIRQMAMSGR